MVSQAQVAPPLAASPPPPASRLPQRRSQHPQYNSATNIEYERNTNHTINGSGSGSGNTTMNSNNNLQMERVTFHLHSRLCNFGLTHTTSRTRNIFETLLLVVAICCACALLMLHRTFVITTTHGTCLDSLEGFDPAGADLTHLVILPHNLTISSSGSTFDESTREATKEPKSMVLWSKGKRKRRRITDCSANFNTENDDSEPPMSKSCAINEEISSAAVISSNEDVKTISYYEKWLEEKLTSNTLPISYSFSTTKAYLMLPHDHFWLKNDMDVQYVLVSPSDPACFGEPFVQFLLWNCFIGGNTVLLNWLRTFQAEELDPFASPTHQELQHSKSYVYDPRTQWLKEISDDHLKKATKIKRNDRKERISSKWNRLLSKIGVFLRTSFLFFFCTTLVSFTLRETQERMLDFTRELSRRVRQSISLSDLITTHLVQNLVFVPIMLGMMFFLIEFYHGDKFLAFSISSIVWCVEGFSLVCLRSSQGLQYFPYFFFLLFLLFHVYQTAFPEHGFVYLALTVVWCFMLHSMIFFWHRYELPALVLGHVSIHRPRMILHQQRSNDDDENEHDNSRSDLHRATTVGASNTTPTLNDQHHNGAMSRTTVASIEGSHLTTPLLSAPQTAPATATATSNASMTSGARNSSSSHLSSNGGGTGLLSSRQSFLSTSTSSRRTSGLYRLNQEDDSSTGSYLYFMGGEVVVHQRRTPGTHSSNIQSNRDLSPPNIRRGNSIGSITENVAQPTTEDAPIESFIRNESNFSLSSSASDAYGIVSTGVPRNNSSNAIGLDVTGRWSGEQDDAVFTSSLNPSSFCDTLPNDTSIETVHISNVSTPQHQQRRNTSDAVADSTSDGCYAHESGSLQAIFETKLTPRHRNTYQQQPDSTKIASSSLLASTAQRPQQQQSTLPSSSSSQSSEIQYQRRPPTFPQLTRGDQEGRTPIRQT